MQLQFLSSWWSAVCRSKHVERLRNTGIINSTTRSHLVGYFYTRYSLSTGRATQHSVYSRRIKQDLYKVFGNTVRRANLRANAIMANTQQISYSLLTNMRFIKKNPTRCNKVSKFYYSIFIWNKTCFGRHNVHHQEPNTALAAPGFSYVVGCWTCSWWTLSGRVLCLTTSSSYTSNNLPRMKNQGLPVQF